MKERQENPNINTIKDKFLKNQLNGKNKIHATSIYTPCQ